MTQRLSKKNKIALGLFLAAELAICFWLASSWIAYKNSLLMGVFIFGIAYLFFSTSLQFLRLSTLLKMRLPSKYPQPATNQKVAAVTTFTANEAPLPLLRQTLEALVELDYPHDTYLLDETNDPLIKQLCQQLGVNHFSRAGQPNYNTNGGLFAARTRHGNYNAWLQEIGYEAYEFIAVFDLDHVPDNHFLTKTLGHFTDPKVGYVQAAQIFYNRAASWIARGAAEKTYFYYSIGQMARYGSYFTILDGCHNVNRIAALKQINGFQPHKADDLLTTLSYVCAGWNGVYLPIKIARGQTPMTWSAYVMQQFQWAYSTLDIKLRHIPKLLPNLSRRQQIAALVHGNSYFSGVTWFVSFCALLLFVVYKPISIGLNATCLLYVVPLWLLRLTFTFWKQQFLIDPKEERGLHWRNTILSYLILPHYFTAFFSALVGRKPAFQVIPKSNPSEFSLMTMFPNLLASGLALITLFYRLAYINQPLDIFDIFCGIVLLINLSPMVFGKKFKPDFNPTSLLIREQKTAH